MRRSIAFVVLIAGICRAQSTDTLLLALDSALTWDGEQWVCSQKLTCTYDGIYLETAIRQRWESTAWANVSRTRYVWRGRRITARMSDVVWGASWKPSDSTVYSYDARGNCTLFVQTCWREQQVELTTTTMTYDADDKMLDSAMAQYIDGALADTVRATFEYTDDNLTGVTRYGYLPDSSFAAVQRLEHTYDAQDRVVTTTMHLNFGTGLMAFARMTNTYTDSKLTETVTETWSFATSAFTNAAREVFYYNASGNDSLTLNQGWNGSEWKDRMRTTLVWLPEGVRTLKLVEERDTTAAEWIPRTLNMYDYTVVQTVGVAAGTNRAGGRSNPTVNTHGCSYIAPGIRLMVVGLNGRVAGRNSRCLRLHQAYANGPYLLRARGADGSGARMESVLLVR